jgi:outer membrane protein OmpA-like peptidoglycan-associated protein
MMKENAGLRVEISGHTDFVGDDAYNKQLSQRRATAVVNYLIKKGIDASRLVGHGYGEEKPLASNDDEREGRELNRRTEFKILGTTGQITQK